MSEPTRRFLFTMWEGGGTLPPELGVARRLIDRGHQVHVLADPTVADDAAAAGCTFSPWRRAPHRTSLDPAEDLLSDWEVRNPLSMLKRIRDVFVAGPAAAYAADTLDEIRVVQPDVVVPDFMLFGAIIGAQAAGLPVAPLVPNIWSIPTRGGPAIGPGFGLAKTALGRARDAIMLAMANRIFDAGLPTLNAARADSRLAPLTSFYDQVLHTDRILVLSSSAFDFAAPSVPANVSYVGPILDDPAWADPWDPVWPGHNDDPLVLVGFSSTFQDQAASLRQVVAALSSLPVRAVVTLGQMLHPAAVEPTANVAVVSSAPHGPVLAEAALVIPHCGHGTTLKALAAGVPLVCMPMGRDQRDTAARVVHHGAGVRLSPTASASRIRKAVMQVLTDERYRTAAARIAAAIATEQNTSDVAGELEAMPSASPATTVADERNATS
jgi:MGT family glycosyltransferase